MKNYVKFIMLFFLLLIYLVGCGGNSFEGMSDKNTDEANRIDFINALNDKKYDDIINVLEGKNLDKENKIVLAKAYLGKGGIDFVELLRNINNYPKEPFSSFAAMFGTDTVTRNQIVERINYFSKIYRLLIFLPNLDCSSSTLGMVNNFNCTLEDEDTVLISTVAASADAVLSISEIVDEVIMLDNMSASEYFLSNDNISIVKETLEKKLNDYLEKNYPNLTHDELKEKLLYKLKDIITNERIQKFILIGKLLDCSVGILLDSEDFSSLHDKYSEFIDKISDSNREITKESIMNYITKEISKL